MSSTTRKPDDIRRRRALSESIARYAELWSHATLTQTVSTRFSTRLSRTWARTDPETRTIVLASSLQGDHVRLEHVLCHELAHIVAFIETGRSEGPHGGTWKRLVRAAGHDPVLRLADGSVPPSTPRSDARRFLHRCHVCDFSRIARKPMKRWRCADCVAAGLSGELIVTEQRRPG